MAEAVKHQVGEPVGRSDVQPYLKLMDDFLTDRLPVASFEREYLDTFSSDDTRWPEPIYRVLNEVFLDVDAYCPDPALRNELDIDEAELRARVERSFAALRRLA